MPSSRTTPDISRTYLWLYVFLMLLAGVGYARWDHYMMDGDGTAFLDISQDLTTGHAHLAVNGYWNPGYSAVIAAARELTHPDRWHELAVTRYANVVILAFAIGATLFFTTALVSVRRRLHAAHEVVLSDGAIHLLGLALLVISIGRELPIAAVRADTLLFAVLMIAIGALLRTIRGGFGWYAIAGVALGCSYLTKSFAFLPSVAVVLALVVIAVSGRSEPLLGQRRKTTLAGALVIAVVFTALAGPYISAISHQLGYFTTGDSARLNYCYFIDQTPRWHEWYWHDLGHATGAFRHPEQVISQQPPVFSYAAHPVGTFPLWFDPAYWTAGLKPHMWLKGHLERLARCTELFVRYLLARPEIFVLLAVILACRVGRPPRRALLVWGVPIGWGLLMLGIYFPVDLQDRYLTAPLFLVLLPIFAALVLPHEGNERSWLPWAGRALVLLFAGIALLQSVAGLAELRRQLPPSQRAQPGYSTEMDPAAHALDSLGLVPGDAVACFGDNACYTDHYWARLAGAQILAEVETPNGADPQVEWDAIPDPQKIIAPLRAMKLKFIVGEFRNSVAKPAGWIQLGSSDFFAYPLQANANTSRR